MTSRLIDCLATTNALADIFSDASMLQAMLDFEVALARGGAAAGLIPPAAALSIAREARAEALDAGAIEEAARASATPAIPFVAALTERVRAVDASSADYVHWGATSQDVTDTAMVLLLKRARPIIAADHHRVERALRELSERHAGTIMLGRTLLQPAAPVTFGLKAAVWCAAVCRSWERLEQAWHAALCIQLGGATGTLAALGGHGMAVAEAAARELELRPVPPWHTDRDRTGALVAACGLYVAALGKTAGDLALLMQAEVAEASEPGGGSSTMPQKRNPAGCAVVLAAATRLPGLVASFLGGMGQEHERGVGGAQAEWPVVAATVQTTGAAVAALAAALEGLAVNPAAMRANVDATGGTIFAEQAVILLAPALGRAAARKLVARAVTRSRQSGEPFGVVLRSIDDVSGALPPDVLAALDRPELYLGVSEQIRARLLSESGE